MTIKEIEDFKNRYINKKITFIFNNLKRNIILKEFKYKKYTTYGYQLQDDLNNTYYLYKLEFDTIKLVETFTNKENNLNEKLIYPAFKINTLKKLTDFDYERASEDFSRPITPDQEVSLFINLIKNWK